MRLKLAFVLVLLLSVGFVMHERKAALEHRLGQVATQLGSRHVKVHCQSWAGNLIDVSGEWGTVQFDASGVPADVTNIKRPACQALKRFAHEVESPAYACVLQHAQDCPQHIWEDVEAVHTLAHETWHLHGISSEAVAECNALQTTARAAELMGADPVAAQAAADWIWRYVYPNEPDEYRMADCVNGGPYDLRPADPVWP